MGKNKSKAFKNVSAKLAKAASVANKVAAPAAYALKYNKELQSAAKFIQKQAAQGEGSGDTLMRIARGASKIPFDQLAEKAIQDPNVQRYLAEKTAGYALKYAEKRADKKFGKYKGYRIGKAGVNFLYDVGTGDVGGALNEATNVYAEVDKNKKRVAKVRGYTSNISKFADSAMKGDAKGLLESGTNIYAMSDPNKKRAAKIQKYSNYASGAIDLYNTGKDIMSAGTDVSNIYKQPKANVQKPQSVLKKAPKGRRILL